MGFVIAVMGAEGRWPVPQAFIILLILLASTATPSAAQPQATLEFHPQTVPLNRHISVTLELVWAGEADVYDIPSPDFSTMTEFEAVEQSLSGARTGDTNRLKYEFTMQPLKQGEYNLDEMNVQYFEKGKDVPIRLELPRAVVRIVSPQLVPRNAKVGIGIAAIVAAGAAAIVLATRSKKRSRQEKGERSKGAADARSRLLAELDAAHRHRIEGEFAAYLEALCAMADSEALRAHIDRGTDLHDLVESVKFAGHTPSPDQLAWAEKLIKSAIERSFPMKDADEEL